MLPQGHARAFWGKRMHLSSYLQSGAGRAIQKKDNSEKCVKGIQIFICGRSYMSMRTQTDITQEYLIYIPYTCTPHKQQQTLTSRVISLRDFIPTNSVPGLNKDIPWLLSDAIVNDSSNHPSEPAGNLGYVFRDGAS